MTSQDFHEWLDVNAGKDPKTMRYRGGNSATEVYVFPQRKHIDAELIRVGGESLLARFNESRFGKALTEGGIKHNTSKKIHRISAFSTVAGWSANQALWDDHMIEDWDQDFNFNWKSLGDPSVLTIPGALFGSNENPLPFELRQEFQSWVRTRGSYISQSIMDTVEVTGMTVDDYGIAFRIAKYDHDLTDPKTLEQKYTPGFANFKHNTAEAIVSEISIGLRAINNSSRDTWAWICAMRSNKDKQSDVIASIFDIAEVNITPFDYNKIHVQGVNDIKLIKMVITGEIDLELALRVDAA